jgi:hypothetical protein
MTAVRRARCDVAALLAAALAAGAVASSVAAQTEAASSAPTVGDTFWVSRAVRVPARWIARAPEWEPDGDVELLGPPAITLRGDSAVIRYPHVVWLPGQRTVDVPAPVLVGPDGAVDSLPAQRVTVSVASVLPARGDSVRPQPPVGIVPRRERVPWPPLLLTLAAVALLVPIHLLWRRRGRPASPSVQPAFAPAPLDRWARDGEPRAVAAAAAIRIRAAMAAGAPTIHRALDTEAAIAAAETLRPDWPLADLAGTLRALDELRFAPAGAALPDALALARAADAVAARLAPAPPAGAAPPAAPAVEAA